VALISMQILIGVIHFSFGALLLAYENTSNLQATLAYDVYTIVFGLLTVWFAVFIWQGKRVGWIGTIAVSFFVIVADLLTLLDLPSIPGIPKSAGAIEIIYSTIVIAYLLSTWKRLANLNQSYLNVALFG
jgi:uncharacterized membrane protein HdeD (DUF308 family)